MTRVKHNGNYKKGVAKVDYSAYKLLSHQPTDNPAPAVMASSADAVHEDNSGLDEFDDIEAQIAALEEENAAGDEAGDDPTEAEQETASDGIAEENVANDTAEDVSNSVQDAEQTTATANEGDNPEEEESNEVLGQSSECEEMPGEACEAVDDCAAAVNGDGKAESPAAARPDHQVSPSASTQVDAAAAKQSGQQKERQLKMDSSDRPASGSNKACSGKMKPAATVAAAKAQPSAPAVKRTLPGIKSKKPGLNVMAKAAAAATEAKPAPKTASASTTPAPVGKRKLPVVAADKPSEKDVGETDPAPEAPQPTAIEASSTKPQAKKPAAPKVGVPVAKKPTVGKKLAVRVTERVEDDEEDDDDDGCIHNKENGESTEDAGQDGSDDMPDQMEVADGAIVKKHAADRQITKPEPSKKPKLTVAKPVMKATVAIATSKPAAKSISKKATEKEKGPPAASKKTIQESSMPKVTRAKTAFMIFLADQRASIKEEAPSISVCDLAKKASELWKALTDDDKTIYQEKANADKARYQEELAAAKAAAEEGGVCDTAAKEEVGKGKNKRRAKEKKPRGPSVKSAYMLFCEANRAEVKELNPEAGAVDMMRLLASAWQSAEADEKAKYEEQHKKLKEELAAKLEDGSEALPAVSKPKAANKTAKTADGAADDARTEEDRAKAVQKSAAKGGKKSKGKPAKISKMEAEDVADNTEDQFADASDESDREDVDWDTHPAEIILGHTSDGKYLVKRKGADLTQYGKVDARAAKRQRFEELSEDDDKKTLPVSVEMVEEYEEFTKRFWTSVHDHTEDGDLDLDDLEAGSILETCYYLGKLQEDHHQLHRSVVRKNGKQQDVFIKVPALGLSMAVQRLLETERKRVAAAEMQIDKMADEISVLKAQLMAQEVGSDVKSHTSKGRTKNSKDKCNAKRKNDPWSSSPSGYNYAAAIGN